MSEPLLCVRGLRVVYGDVVALDGVDLRVDAGTICGLIGTNGSGKSTLLNAIIGTVTGSGVIRIQGGEAATARAEGRVAHLPQAEAVDWRFPISVREVVMTGRYARLGPTRRPGSDDHRAVDTALERVGLADLAGRRIGALSGGQRKRAFIARGIAQGASLLLLDEPFAGVDRPNEEMITGLLRELADAGTAVVVSTHDLRSLPDLAHRVVLLRRRVLAAGTPAEVLRSDQLSRVFGP